MNDSDLLGSSLFSDFQTDMLHNDRREISFVLVICFCVLLVFFVDMSLLDFCNLSIYHYDFGSLDFIHDTGPDEWCLKFCNRPAQVRNHHVSFLAILLLQVIVQILLSVILVMCDSQSFEEEKGWDAPFQFLYPPHTHTHRQL